MARTPRPADNAALKAWTQATRRALIVQLGGRCEACGERRPSRLEFHHYRGRTWDPAKTSQCHRVSIYRREIAAGLVGLLCRRCNAATGRPA